MKMTPIIIFFNDVINDRDIVLLSNGKATRTFCYISDAIEGYLRVLLSNYNGQPFNIGTDFPEISMIDLANHIIRLSGKKLKVKFQASIDPNYVTDNPQKRCPSIDKAKRLLGYNPNVSLEEGLKRTYEYYQSHRWAEESLKVI